MYTKTVTVQNPSGLHARPASDFIKCASSFKSRLTAKRAGAKGAGINAKSIVLILSQGFAQGEEIELTATGEDEESCVNTLVDLINSGFGEL